MSYIVHNTGLFTPASGLGWQNISLAGIVPSGTTGVAIKVFNPNTNSADFDGMFFAAPTGDRTVDPPNDLSSFVRKEGATLTFVKLDSNLTFDLWIDDLETKAGSPLIFAVKYAFDQSATWFSSPAKRTLTSNGVWSDWTPSSAGGELALLINIHGGWQGGEVGARCKGNTIDDYVREPNRVVGMIVPTDSNGSIEIQDKEATVAGATFYCAGYLTSGFSAVQTPTQGGTVLSYSDPTGNSVPASVDFPAGLDSYDAAVVQCISIPSDPWHKMDVWKWNDTNDPQQNYALANTTDLGGRSTDGKYSIAAAEDTNSRFLVLGYLGAYTPPPPPPAASYEFKPNASALYDSIIGFDHTPGGVSGSSSLTLADFTLSASGDVAAPQAVNASGALTLADIDIWVSGIVQAPIPSYSVSGAITLEAISLWASGLIPNTDSWARNTSPWDSSLFALINSRPVMIQGLNFMQADTFLDDGVGKLASSHIERQGIPLTQGKVDLTSVKLIQGFWGLFRGGNGDKLQIYIGAQKDTPSDVVTWTGPFDWIIGQTEYIDTLVSGRYGAIKVVGTEVRPWVLEAYALDFELGGLF